MHKLLNLDKWFFFDFSTYSLTQYESVCVCEGNKNKSEILTVKCGTEQNIKINRERNKNAA